MGGYSFWNQAWWFPTDQMAKDLYTLQSQENMDKADNQHINLQWGWFLSLSEIIVIIIQGTYL